MRIFLYGTLLDPGILALRSGRRGLERGAVPAILPGWRRVTLRHAPFPTLLRGRRGAVGGLLLVLRGAALRRLAAYEGPAYRLRPIRPMIRRGPRDAVAWIAAPALADPDRPWHPPPTDAARGIVNPRYFNPWLARSLHSRAW